MISEVIIGQFARIGARVLTSDGTDLTSAADDPTRTLIRQVLVAVAQFDKTVTILKLRGARERKRRKTGRCEGRKPFGAHPSEIRTFARIRKLRRKPKRGERLSLAAITERLNAEGTRRVVVGPGLPAACMPS
jgi:hypothetical protein